MNAKVDFIDYKKVKQDFPLFSILEHYGVNPNAKKRAICPFCEKETFSASEEKNAWHCFACNRKGNVLDFVALQEDCPVNEAAHIIRGLGSPASSGVENKPLTDYEPICKTEHKDLVWQKETIEYFGLGYCTKGMHVGKVIAPIHNKSGELLAYAGYKEGVWKYPKDFNPELELFNQHRVKPGKLLIVCDDIIGVLEMHEQGHRNVVALLSDKITEAQGETLLSLNPPRVGVYADNKKGIEILSQLVLSFYCKLKKRE